MRVCVHTLMMSVCESIDILSMMEALCLYTMHMLFSYRMGCQAFHQLPICHDGLAPASTVLCSQAASTVWAE